MARRPREARGPPAAEEQGTGLQVAPALQILAGARRAPSARWGRHPARAGLAAAGRAECPARAEARSRSMSQQQVARQARGRERPRQPRARRRSAAEGTGRGPTGQGRQYRQGPRARGGSRAARPVRRSRRAASQPLGGAAIRRGGHSPGPPPALRRRGDAPPPRAAEGVPEQSRDWDRVGPHREHPASRTAAAVRTARAPVQWDRGEDRRPQGVRPEAMRQAYPSPACPRLLDRPP